MPSSPQTITTRGVFDYLESTAGKAIVGATINCTLNFNGASVTSPIVNVGELQQSTTTDQNGFWRFNLVPNDTLTPTGTLYTIQTPVNTYDISVPSGGADVQSSSIVSNAPSVLSPALTGLTGPITVTGNETVTGNLTVSGTTTLGSTTTGALTTAAETVGGDLTISSAFRLLFGAAAAKIIPGATSISHRNNADSADNVLITDAGAVTVRNGITLTAGDAVLTAGRLLISSAAAKILGGATSLSLRNTADSADNVLVTDAGLVTLRNGLLLPVTSGGTLPANTAYSAVPIKYDDQSPTGASFTIPASGLIPGGFWKIRITWFGRTTSGNTSDLLNLTSNADAGANYDSESLTSTGATVTGAAQTAQTSMRVGVLAGGGAAANLFNSGWIEIAGYAINNNRRALTYQCWRNDASTGFDSGAGAWRNAANAITSITLAAAAGNFASGSRFVTELYP